MFQLVRGTKILAHILGFSWLSWTMELIPDCISPEVIQVEATLKYDCGIERRKAYKSMNEPSTKEIDWRDYALSADIYKFYVDILLKFNIFYYGITGGIVSYCLSQHQIAILRWALVLPLLMSVFFGGLFLFTAVP
jgi:hypothetical protein